MPESEDRAKKKNWKRSWIELFAHAVTLTESTVDGAGEQLRIIHLLLERYQRDEIEEPPRV